jgi:hypothetical protein
VRAFWDGGRLQFGYGYAGDFAGALDVVAHEFTHAVIQFVVGTDAVWTLGGHDEADALNEAYADIFGSLIEGKPTGRDRWMMGEDSSIINYRSLSEYPYYRKYVRNMSTQRHFSDFLRSCPFGGELKGDCPYEVCPHPGSCAHTNSQIFSHAAYLMMYSLTSTISNEVWANVFYRSLYRLPTNATFIHAAYAVVSSAMFQGFTADQIRAVEQGFVSVGIDIISVWDKIDELIAWARQQPRVRNAPYYFFMWRLSEYWIVFFDSIEENCLTMRHSLYRFQYRVPFAAVNTYYVFVGWGRANVEPWDYYYSWLIPFYYYFEPGEIRFVQTNNQILYDGVIEVGPSWQRGMVHIE